MRRTGEFVAIMGQSGCGKSTLLHLLGGLLARRAARLSLTAKIYRKFPTRSERIFGGAKSVSFSEIQSFSDFDGGRKLKLAERIHTGNGGGSAERRREVLRLLKLENKINNKPLELSGGEQQRVALARASSIIRR
jgi:ABC-type lipoprotein export system ATPase subunit